MGWAKIAGIVAVVVVIITLIVLTIYFATKDNNSSGCPKGQILKNGLCVNTSPECPNGKILQNGICVDVSPTCPTGKVLQNGVCVDVSPTCPTGKVLQNGVCVDVSPTCPTGQVLQNGVCSIPYVPTNPVLGPVCTPPCENGGTCTNSGCVCKPGYLGVNCAEADIQYFCPNSRCNTIIDPATCKCICPEGVIGKNCNIIDADYNQCVSGSKYPGLMGVWDGYKCLWTRQDCPIQSSVDPVCSDYSNLWFAHDPLSSDPYQCFIGDEYDGKTIGDSGSYYSGDRCMLGSDKIRCEELLRKIGC